MTANGSTAVEGAAKASVGLGDPFAVNYYVNANTIGPDDTLRIVDPDPANDEHLTPVCANIYVFDAQQEMEECCACPITPAGRLDFSLNHNLTSVPVTGVTLNTGTIKIVRTNINPNLFLATPPNGTKACDATNGSGGSLPPNNVFTADEGFSLFSWLTHDLNKFNTGGQAVQEAEFQSTDEPGSDLVRLQDNCTTTQNAGAFSGLGTCTCPAGPVP